MCVETIFSTLAMFPCPLPHRILIEAHKCTKCHQFLHPHLHSSATTICRGVEVTNERVGGDILPEMFKVDRSKQGSDSENTQTFHSRQEVMEITLQL